MDWGLGGAFPDASSALTNGMKTMTLPITATTTAITIEYMSQLPVDLYRGASASVDLPRSRHPTMKKTKATMLKRPPIRPTKGTNVSAPPTMKNKNDHLRLASPLSLWSDTGTTAA